jgi:hypothetical protein
MKLQPISCLLFGYFTRTPPDVTAAFSLSVVCISISIPLYPLCLEALLARFKLLLTRLSMTLPPPCCLAFARVATFFFSVMHRVATFFYSVMHRTSLTRNGTTGHDLLSGTVLRWK